MCHISQTTGIKVCIRLYYESNERKENKKLFLPEKISVPINKVFILNLFVLFSKSKFEDGKWWMRSEERIQNWDEE